MRFETQGGRRFRFEFKQVYGRCRRRTGSNADSFYLST
jgi:hypothetical protein